MFRYCYLLILAGLLECIACQQPPKELPSKHNGMLNLPPELQNDYQQGLHYFYTQPDSALFYLQRLKRRSIELHSVPGIGIANLTMGIFAANNGNNEQAFTLFQEALPYALKDTPNITLPLLYNNIGNYYNLQGNYPKARHYYQLSLQSVYAYNLQNKLPNIALIYNNISDVYLNTKEYEKALQYASQAEQFFQRNNVTPTAFASSLILLNKGEAYIGLEQYPQAFTTLQQCLQIVQKKSDREIEPSVWSSLGSLMLHENKNQQAVTYLERAIHNKATNVYATYILPRYRLGLAYYRVQRYHEAKQVLQEALQKANQTGQLNATIEAHATLSLVYQALNDYPNALAQQKEVVLLKDSLMGIEKINAISAIEIKLENARKNKELAEKQLQISHQENSLNKKNMWIGGISSIALFLGILFFSRNRINKQKQLVQEKQIHFMKQQEDLLEKQLEITRLEAVLKGEEKERIRIGRNLHDGIVSQLFAVKLHFRGALQNMKDPVALKGFQQTLQYLEEATSDLRTVAHNLLPEMVLQRGLSKALQYFCKKMETASDIKIYLQQYISLDELTDKAMELSLYRILQELVQNAIKHAECRYILIQFYTDGQQWLQITVEDDGKGFLVSEAQKGMGLQGVYSRVKALRGKITIDSRERIGTTINMEFPLAATQEKQAT